MEKSYLSLPLLPGVYLFKDSQNAIIYVGKAKLLRKRVASYFQKQHEDWKIKSLIDEHSTIEHIVTHTEAEALLLEAQLIKEHQPKFNVLLKNGQPFLYLTVTADELPRLELTRAKKRKGVYFGPFIQNKGAVRAGYDYLIRTFRLDICNRKIPDGCLRYHIGICAGACKDDFDKEGYLFRINLATSLLRGNYKESLAELRGQIAKCVLSLQFEKARQLNYYLQNLDTIFANLKVKFSERKYAQEVAHATAPERPLKIGNLALGKQLQEMLKLDTAPASIDCFDISHFQSKSIVGSCIRFVNGVPDKNSFRRFALKTIEQQNDYAALQEIVGRRYRNPEEMPDLILIDGGKGQLSAVASLFPEHAAKIVSLAKREERLFSKEFSDGILLDKQTEVGRLLIALRDYAHHFAITYHRQKRSKRLEG
ncbi:MAG TPA: GIY-YIG nuclease family protein [Candidatus Babeliales bacterium]|nr:GIY-YIG nuclease family protein [Candidatus Babeliales bacterium]